MTDHQNSSAASEGARLSNWLADYSHDLKEEGDFDQEAGQLDKASQWIADHLNVVPQPARESDFEQAFRDACDEVGCECNNETLLSSIANLTSSPRAFAAIAAERQRQISAEGWTLEHDDSHISGELAMAAAVYALTSFLDTEHSRNTAFTRYWPWDRSWFKPVGGRRDLVRAAALIVAEIERLDRASSPLTRPECATACAPDASAPAQRPRE